MAMNDAIHIHFIDDWLQASNLQKQQIPEKLRDIDLNFDQVRSEAYSMMPAC